MRVLFLTRYPYEGASSRYRVYQYIPHLEALGVDCTVQSFMDLDMYRLSLAPGHAWRKSWQTLRASMRRLGTLLSWRDYDLIYMQRELLPFGPPLIERLLKKLGAVLLFDYDDALFIKKASRYNPLATLLRSPGKTLQIFRLVDCVVAGNDWLRDAAVAHGAHAVTLEVAEDTGRIKLRPLRTDGPSVTVGWLGSPSTVKYLWIIEPVLQELAKRYPSVRFELMGGGDFAMPGVPWQLYDWSLSDELEALRRFDIGLMPLPDELWSNGKSGGKARTYMAAGVVPVCTAIGYNLELVDDGVTGFLCRTDEEWLEKLCRLIEEPDLRCAMARAARADVEARFAPARQAAALHTLLVKHARRDIGSLGQQEAA